VIGNPPFAADAIAGPPMPLSTDRKIVLAVGFMFLFLVALAAIGVSSTRRFEVDASWVSHTHELRAELREFSRRIDAAKGDLRGYLLTGDSAYLTRYRANLRGTESAFERVRLLSADRSEQQARLAIARRLITSCEAAFDSTLALAAPGPASLAAAARLAIGEQLTAQIDSIVDAADLTEQILLEARSARQTRSERLSLLAPIAIVVAAIGIALVFSRSIRRDFSGRARAEAAARASEAKFAGILEIAAEGIITIDERQSIVHFNHAAEEIFGYTELEILGKPLEMLLPSAHSRDHRSHVASFAAGSASARRMGGRRAINGRRKDGTEFPADASISKLETPSGWIFTAVLRDITERRRLEDRNLALATAGVLLAQAPEYDDVLVVAAQLPVPSVGVWSVLDVVEETESNEPVFARIASRHPDPAVDAALRVWERDPLDVDSPEVAVDVLRTREARLVASVSDDWLEAHVATPRHVELARRVGMHSLIIVPLVVHDRVFGVWTIGSSAEHAFDASDVALATDLAERTAQAIENARLLRHARRATAARDQVLSVVSHDLRNPVSAVSMFARRLVDSSSDEETRTIGQHILTAVDWMHRLMQDLLDVASIEAGRLSIELEPQAPHQIIESVVEIFADRAASQRVNLRTDVLANAAWVSADASRITQVLGNLVSNALRFTPIDGAVTVGARTDGAGMTFWVQDTGCGIPASELPRVFDRFWHARRGRAARGTGLGLAIAQGIVHAHGGQISVDSVIDEGSTFSFNIPLAGPSGVPASLR
jgi:PAS domain S-box-containing protein